MRGTCLTVLASFDKSHRSRLSKLLPFSDFFISFVIVLVSRIIAIFYLECTPRSTDSSVGSSEGSINQVRFQDPLCTIHSYEIEHSDSDSLVPNETHDSDDEEMYMDSKWSTWCWSENKIGSVTWAWISKLPFRVNNRVCQIKLLFGKFFRIFLLNIFLRLV